MEQRIWLTSDLHFCHNREFLYAPRGFASVDEMNNSVVERWNRAVNVNDIVYILGDLMLNDNEEGMHLLRQLNGELHIILGNHDTDSRIALYKTLPNVAEICFATRLKYNGYHFYLSHYPTFTANLEKESLRECTINLYGHTHQRTNFYQDIPFMYHVGLDSHNCTPITIDQIITDCIAKVEECKNQL